MPLEIADVHRIAHLARIEIDRDEALEVQRKLGAIFGLIDDLLAVDTENVEPMAHAQDVTLAMREDAVSETDRHREYQAAAPAVEDDLYLVPRVIE